MNRRSFAVSLVAMLALPRRVWAKARPRGIVAKVQYTMPDGTVHAFGVKRETCNSDEQFLRMVNLLGRTLEREVATKLGVP